MLGTSITDCIIENKDKIKYIREVYEDTGSYWLFKLYFNKRNIFGFRKYIKIISYTDPQEWTSYYKQKNEKFGFNIKMEFPAWNPFACDNYVQIEPGNQVMGNRKLSEILYEIWYRDTYKEESSRWEKLGKVLNKNLE